MSGRYQTLMRTRCPACNTVFRVTSEQLRAKAGKVRCGYCKSIFNAFDGLVDDKPATVAPPPEASPTLAGPSSEITADVSPDIDEVGPEQTVTESAPIPETETLPEPESEPEPEPEPDP